MNEYKLKRLGDVASFINGYTFKSSDWKNTGCPIIRIQNLNNPESSYNYFDGEIDKKYIVNSGDILISWSASIGVYEWKKGKALLNQHIFKVDFNKGEINKTYFKYMVEFAINRSLNHMQGSTMKHFTKKNFENILIPVPDLKKQARLSELIKQTELLVYKRKRQIAALSSLKQSVFLDMFGDPNNVENKYPKLKISDLYMVQTGKTPSRKNSKYWYEGELPWIKTGEVNNTIIEKSEEFVTETAIKETNLKVFPKNTILIAMYGQGKTRGRSGLLAFPASTNQACAALIPNEEMNTIFTWNQLLLQYNELRALGRGGNQSNLNLELVRNFELIVPSKKLQYDFENKFNKMESLSTKLTNSLIELEKLYESILHRSFEQSN